MSLREDVRDNTRRIDQLFKYDNRKDQTILDLHSDLSALHAKHNSLQTQFDDLKEKFEAIVKQQRIRFVEVAAVPAHVVARSDRG